MVLKSTIIPSYIAYRLSIIKLALIITEVFSVEILNLIGTRANLLAMIVVGAAVPVNPNINIFGELMLKFIKVTSHAEKIGFSKVLTEIVGNSQNQSAREETAYHLAKYAVKAHRHLLVESNYTFKVSFGENKHICKNLVTFPSINVVREFAQSPEICALKKGIVIGREARFSSFLSYCYGH